MNHVFIALIAIGGSATAAITTQTRQVLPRPANIRIDLGLLRLHIQSFIAQLEALHQPALEPALHMLGAFDANFGSLPLAALQNDVTFSQLQDQHDLAIDTLLDKLCQEDQRATPEYKSFCLFIEGFQLLTMQLLHRIKTLKTQQEANELTQAMALLQQLFQPIPQLSSDQATLWRLQTLKTVRHLLWQDGDLSVLYAHLRGLVAHIPATHTIMANTKRSGALPTKKAPNPGLS